MDSTAYIALSRIDVLKRGLEITANNLANENTDGFKTSRQMFSQYLVHQKGPGHINGETDQVYAQDKATFRDFIQGPLRSTGNATDVAINGEGYFAVRTTQGVRLTRNGQFTRRLDGTITDGSGNPVLDRNGRNLVLRQENEDFTIAKDGTISTNDGALGMLGVVTVKNPQTLVAEGQYLLKPTTPTQPVAMPELHQAMLEGSNVNAVSETTHLVEIQRDYDLTFQLIQTESTRNQNAIDKITAEPTT
ncbi:flagellar basal-body rod protein FlgF [Asaia siamensis]|uniref:Flagellar basal-body rod protein FlgF n=1 Tax=Asaia siamensis TaxID=110479 RepID=A0ABQ1L3A7_9PROT|nr:flagellar basal-body rod protein FlgF [Asaia siamensis]GBR09820.1 flagellar basal body rod protein FlgF [Asaia siamensis NRIC 0323]GGC18924.1 flagellar basal-body rod protein FlgF [Asaia siamensis]